MARSEFDDSRGRNRTIRTSSLALSDYPETGFQIETLSLWGVNSDFIQARLAGDKLDKNAVIARRIHAKNVSLYGLENLFNQVIEPMSSAIEEDYKELGLDPSEFGSAFSIDDYNFNIADLIVSELSLHEFELNRTTAPELLRNFADAEDDHEELQTIWNLYQTLAAWNTAYGWKDAVFFDMNFGMNMDNMGGAMNFNGLIESIGYKSYDRGDLEYAAIGKMHMDVSMEMPAIGYQEGAKPFGYTQRSESEYSRISDMRLGTVMKYIALGQPISKSETDVLSLGRFESGPSKTFINDTFVYGAQGSLIDVSEFHWLLPEKIEIRVDKAAYDLAGYMTFMTSLMASAGGEAEFDAEFTEVMTKATEILEKHGLKQLVFDLGIKSTWSAETGKSAGKHFFDIEKMGRTDYASEYVFPDFDMIAPHIPDNLSNIDMAAIGEVFTENAKFIFNDVAFIDEGGLERSFAMAVEFAKLAPDNPGLAGTRNSTPEKLREIAANGLFLGAGEIDKAFPPAVDYLQSFSDFILKGGRLDISVRPPEPLSAHNADEIEALIQDDPEKAEDMLGLKVTHTPPN